MNKLNNKGMTIVEVIVTFVMLMILVLGMLNMTNEIKTASKEKQFYKELNEYSSLVQSTVQDDLITHGLVDVEVCSSSSADFCLNLKFKDNTNKKLIVNGINATISYNGINYIVPMKDYINNIFNTSYYVPSYSFDNGIFVLDFPVFENLYGDGYVNYGFKIVHLTEEAYE